MTARGTASVAGADAPAPVMSGYAGAQLTRPAGALGATDILRKPLVRQDIAESLERAFALC
jgi:FixJ family two-component response regulator